MATYTVTYDKTILSNQAKSWLVYIPIIVDWKKRVQVGLPLSALYSSSRLGYGVEMPADLIKQSYHPLSYDSRDNALKMTLAEARAFNSVGWETPRQSHLLTLFEGHTAGTSAIDGGECKLTESIRVEELPEYQANAWSPNDRTPVQQLTVLDKPAYVVMDRINGSDNLNFGYINGLSASGAIAHYIHNGYLNIQTAVNWNNELGKVPFKRTVLASRSDKINREDKDISRFDTNYQAQTPAQGFVLIAEGCFKKFLVDNANCSDWVSKLNLFDGATEEQHANTRNSFRQLVNALIVNENNNNNRFSISAFEDDFISTKTGFREGIDLTSLRNQLPPAEMVFLSGVGSDNGAMQRFCG